MKIYFTYDVSFPYFCIMKKHFIVFILLFCFCYKIYAINDTSVSKPKAILVMLHISKNKILALEKRGQHNEVGKVQEADNEINTSIIKDFKKHFNYCAVYFFYDTQLNYVLEKQWSFVTLYDFDHLLTPKKIELRYLDQYLIVDVDYPPATFSENSKGNNEESDVFINTRDYGLLTRTEDFKFVKGKLKYTNISLRRKGNILKSNDMKYIFEGAKIYQTRLMKYYNESILK